MILRNDNYTFTADFENVTAEPIYNANTVTTIGGIMKTQLDSRRLKIISQIRIKQSQMADMHLVIEDYTLPLYYTPNCKLYDRTAIEELEVVMTTDPKVDERIWQDDKIFYVTFEFEEVLTG